MLIFEARPRGQSYVGFRGELLLHACRQERSPKLFFPDFIVFYNVVNMIWKTRVT